MKLDRQIRKVNLQFALDRALLLLSCVLFLSSSYISNYNATIDEAWLRWNSLMYFNFTLMFLSLQKEVIRLITKPGYLIMLCLLVNYFIDKHFNLIGWSWNDIITILVILFELVFTKLKVNK